MELELIRNIDDLKDYFIDVGLGHMLPSLQELQPFQKFFFINNDGEKIGFLQIHYEKPRPDAFLADFYIEEIFRNEEINKEFMRLVEEKAREFGATSLFTNVEDEMIEQFKKEGFEIMRTTCHIKKEL